MLRQLSANSIKPDTPKGHPALLEFLSDNLNLLMKKLDDFYSTDFGSPPQVKVVIYDFLLLGQYYKIKKEKYVLGIFTYVIV